MVPDFGDSELQQIMETLMKRGYLVVDRNGGLVGWVHSTDDAKRGSTVVSVDILVMT